MRKLIIMTSIIAISGTFGAGASLAQTVGTAPQVSTQNRPQSLDPRKADWFAHAVDDILSGHLQSTDHQGRSVAH